MARRRSRKQGSPAPKVEDPVTRRFLAWETLIVLAIFPLPSTLAALYYLTLRVDVGSAVVHDLVLPHLRAVSFLLDAGTRVAELAAVALVLYLLARSGEGIRSIGLGRRELRSDLALVPRVWFGVMVIPFAVGGIVLRLAHLHSYRLVHVGVRGSVVYGLVTSVVAGVLEEVVVLGYLVRRLEQRGWSAESVIAVAVGVRVSYHLYYGPGAIPIALWALAAVLMYRRVRRLTPFIVCHVVWDADLTVARGHPAAGGAMILIFLVAMVVMYLLWRNWSPKDIATDTPSPVAA